MTDYVPSVLEAARRAGLDLDTRETWTPAEYAAIIAALNQVARQEEADAELLQRRMQEIYG